MFADFYRGKRVFLTGHTGFKGAWLALWLRELGAAVHGFALDPPRPELDLCNVVQPRVFGAAGGGEDTRGDVRDLPALGAALDRAAPDLVFHLAAQPLVRLSYAEPLATFQTNALGTAHLLEAVRKRNRACAVVIVSSDKCYENREWEWAYRESDPLGGHDVYSMSKAATELVAAAWRRSFFQTTVDGGSRVRLATARAGNVIGGGDYAADRIVPDSVEALAAGRAVPVRNPHATRPWQHVLECLGGYLSLGARLATAAPGAELAAMESAFNFGPGPGANRPVGELVAEFLRHWPGGRWEDLSGAAGRQPHEAGRLNLAIDRAQVVLGWSPAWSFPETVARTAAWYHARHVHGADPAAMLELCRRQVADYAAAAGPSPSR